MDNRIPGSLKITTWLVLCSVLLSGLLLPALVHAQTATPTAPAVQVAPTATGATILYTAPLQAAVNAAAWPLPRVYFQGYQLPMQVLAFTSAQGTVQTLHIQEVVSNELAVKLEPVAAPVPPALDWQPDPNEPVETPRLPDQPVFVLRHGMIRGQQVLVVAVSPVFEENGVQKLASSILAVVPGAAPANPDLLGEATAAAFNASRTPEVVTVPVNQAALTNSYKIAVGHAGMQEVPYSAVGVQPDANLQLTYQGQPVAIEKRSTSFRFYAPSAGDRWNATTTYWLTTLPGVAAVTMATAAGAVDAGAAAGTAYEHGVWVDNRLYNSSYAGGDGDRWFNSNLQVAAGTALASAPTVNLPVAAVLPGTSGESTYVASVTAIVNIGCLTHDQNYRLGFDFLAGGSTADAKTKTWNPAPDCKLESASLVTATTTAQAEQLTLRLVPNPDYTTSLLIDRVSWERPVSLDFLNAANGAEFWTHSGAATYTLSNLPGNWSLYDVTDPLTTKLLASGAGGSYGFTQGAGAPASHYALVATAQTPAVAAHAAVNLGDVKAANAIYIGPANFAAGLAPLLALRQQQGFVPLFVDVQGIYDVYGWGQVSGTAIRNFLRDKTDWQNAARKIAVVLAGDSTYDPFGYEGKLNANVVAAYMADVDRFIHEVPCEQCYAQLNGDDPSTGDNTYDNNGKLVSAWFATDIWVGRFPVRNETELAAVVQKIVAYDTTGSDSDVWRSRFVFLADNYIKALDANQNALVDAAGNFPALSQAIIDRLPALARVQRIYYDPAPQRELVNVDGALQPAPGATGYYVTEPRKTMEPWRISDPTLVNSSVIGAMNGGAAIVTYNGHSHHWQYAITQDGATPSWLFYINDAEVLNNRDQLFIALSMTCYTSQFTKPATNGTVDEVLFRRPNGGAVATWGSSGLSVVEGHDLLQKGFMDKLWSSAAGDRYLGGLMEAGYTTLLTSGASEADFDALKTFMLFGDPLTKARVNTSSAVYIPTAKR